MAAMTTTLNNYSSSSNQRRYFTAGHTTQEPKIVIAARKEPVGNQVIYEASLVVSHATTDDDGEVLPQRSSITCQVRGSKQGQSTDMDAIKVIFRDFVAADEFDALVDSLAFPAGTG